MLDIDIDSSGNVQIQGRLFRVSGADRSLAGQLRRLVAIVRGLPDIYGAFLSNDGKLIGQEKIELTHRLEEGMMEILQLRQLLDGAGDFAIPIPRTRTSLHFSMNDDMVRGSGRLGGGLSLQKERFSRWLFRMRDERLTSLLQKSSEAFRDGTLSDEERALLIKDVNLLFLGFLLSRESLLRGQME